MEREDEIERKEWSLCCICEGDYRKDIRINAECLHSYCYECIVQTSSTSTLCPICETPLPTPLSSLPQNHVLITWRSLSPPSPFSLTSIDNFNNDSGNDIQDSIIIIEICEGCEEKNAKLNCKECAKNYCKECFDYVHTLKAFQKHKTPTEIEISSPINNFANNASQKIKTILDYEECDKNNHKKMKEIYCEMCDQFICLYCMDEDHHDHFLISALKYVEVIKGKWESFRESVAIKIKSKFDVNTNMKIVNDHLSSTNKEIERLEEELRKLYLQKKKYEKIISLNLQVEKEIDISLRFIRHFITTLPLLPLSSYYPFLKTNTDKNDIDNGNPGDNNDTIADNDDDDDNDNDDTDDDNSDEDNNDDNNSDDGGDSNDNNDSNEENNNEENKLEITRRMKIKQMMEEDKLEKVFSSIDPSLSTSSLLFHFNLLEEGKNEISSFQIKRGISNPHSISLFLSSDLLIITNFNSIYTSDTKFYKLDGSIYEGNPIKRDYSLILNCSGTSSHIYLPKKNLIYISRNTSEERISKSRKRTYNYQRSFIEIYTFNDQKLVFQIDGKYLNEIKGMGKSVKLDLLFVCDYSNKRIFIFKLSSGEFHSKIELDFRPTSIDLSKSANLLIISNYDKHSIYLFTLFPPHNNKTDEININNNGNINNIDIPSGDENGCEESEEDQEIKPTLFRKIKIEKEFGGRISEGQSIAIHSKEKYFVVVVTSVDNSNSKLIFFNYEGDFITSFQPTNKQLTKCKSDFY